ncbi:ATP-binding protein [Corallibacter sp.]|uniref:PorY family sensor histidine kinase n=1 Tax=Corallibacter sp. TaxID=2038084 RepID=UPI003A956E0F
MKLLNQSLNYLSISILTIITAWSVLFYFNMLNEIKSSIDEGLENYKRLIILNAQQDSTILTKTYFDESFFTIKQIDKQQALKVKDSYVDTVLYMQDADDEQLEQEPVRMLITAFELNDNYYELKVANSMVEEDDLIKELLKDTIWLYISLLVCIVLINNFVLKKLWTPFYEFLYQLKAFRLGKSKLYPKVKTKTKEFLDLQDTVTNLLKHTTDVYDQQKQFIGNAAHELQTPLAITINKLELLIEDGQLQDKQANDIAEVMNIIERLTRLNKSLLLLSKIENRQFFQNEQILINDVVKDSLSNLKDIIDYKKIKVTVNENKKASVNIDKTLASIIISNLIRNAVFHNVETGYISITIEKESITISNSGNNVSLDENLIFKRFYKPNQESTGAGLGLAIVKAISDSFNFQVTYAYKNLEHSFQVVFS